MTVHSRALDYPQSFLSRVIPDEAELTAGRRIEPGRSYGFFTDTTLCIGCKACEVACKEWNALPADDLGLRGTSYDNTGDLSATTWRHVHFIEHIAANGERATAMPPFQSNWLMMSDVCKHCERAGCLEACPTGAILRTEFGTVYVQPDVCNGCGYCVSACPFGVIDRRTDDGRAWKCTLCYDRLKEDLVPACAKSCPTASIQFGEIGELKERARNRVEELHGRGVAQAYLYGADAASQPGTEGLHAFFLLCDVPEKYNLPADPVVPTKKLGESWRAMAWGVAGLMALAVGSVLSARRGL
jgi:formate dehydrogenase iron-sulfur subunit